jgi:predicted RecA/RadA family phage recombinase
MDNINKYMNRGEGAIKVGYAVQVSSNGGIEAYNGNGNFLGVALQDIEVGELGDVCDDGYISRIYLEGLRDTTITEGDGIYINDDGSFSTSGEKASFYATDNQNVQIK